MLLIGSKIGTDDLKTMKLRSYSDELFFPADPENPSTDDERSKFDISFSNVLGYALDVRSDGLVMAIAEYETGTGTPKTLKTDPDGLTQNLFG